MRLNLSVIEDYWAPLGAQTHKRVSERTGGRLSGSTETPNSNCARAEKNSSAMSRDIPGILDWLTPSCMIDLLETEGGVDHGDVG